jgi:hypothetical protein
MCVHSAETWYGLERHTWAWIVGGLFAGMATVWALAGIICHLVCALAGIICHVVLDFEFETLKLCFIYMRWVQVYNHDARIKRWEILVLCMVPVYAGSAWLGLFNKDISIFLDLLREAYESVCIYSFFQFLVAVLGGTQSLITTVHSKLPLQHIAPFNWCCHFPSGAAFVTGVRQNVFQYVWIRLVLSLCTFVLEYAPHFFFCDSQY